MPPVIGKLASYDDARVISATVGATALKEGALCKFSGGLLVAAEANDKQLALYVCLGYGAVSAVVSAVPLSDAKLKIAYTGGTPEVGAVYGIDDAYTLDYTDTTNKMLVVTKVGGDLETGYAEVIEYQLSA